MKKTVEKKACKVSIEFINGHITSFTLLKLSFSEFLKRLSKGGFLECVFSDKPNYALNAAQVMHVKQMKA